MLKMGTYHNANVLLMCGDLTGKAIVPIVKRKENEWYCRPRGTEQVIRSKEDLDKAMETFRNRGFYTFETTPQEVEELKASKELQEKLFVGLTTETMKRWLDMVREKTPSNVKVIVSPGNDDDFEIDEFIRKDERVIYPLERVVQLDDRHELISCPYVNPSPWQTYRECSEEELRKKLEKEFSRVSSCENLVCNFHAPPKNTNVDLAPKLKNLKPVTEFGSPVMEHVGSQAVRDAIQVHQPLLGLHGHIHESCGFDNAGRTLCLNPGSEYEAGLLRGYVIDLPEKGHKLNFWRVEA